MSRWSMARLVTEGSTEPRRAVESGQAEYRIARAAVALLRGDVAVLETGARAVMASAHGVQSGESARQLANPLDALRSGYQSQLSVPLWRNGRRVGALAVLGKAERHFSEADIALLRALAGRVDQVQHSIH